MGRFRAPPGSSARRPHQGPFFCLLNLLNFRLWRCSARLPTSISGIKGNRIKEYCVHSKKEIGLSRLPFVLEYQDYISIFHHISCRSAEQVGRIYCTKQRYDLYILKREETERKSFFLSYFESTDRTLSMIQLVQTTWADEIEQTILSRRYWADDFLRCV